MRRVFHYLLLVSLISTAGWSANSIGSLRPHVLTLEVQRAIALSAPHEQLRVIVHLSDHASQTAIIHWLHQHSIEDIQPFWIFNGLAISASREVVLDLAQRPEVERISLDAVITMSDEPIEASTAADNLAAIGAPAAWAHGFTGKGIVVAVLDSGVDMTHPQLAARWRGGDNSWFDPNGEHDTPFDFDGHGTQVLSVILGGEVDGTALGVAPDAQWIAAKVFDDRNRATVAGIHQALQWVLDPDGDPATADAPQVVNSSWSFVNGGCDLEFADDLQALRKAGILPVFAAGIRDSVSPANTPQAFAVGALAHDGSLLSDSPRGPSLCGETHSFPQIVAPGEDIHTIDRFGFTAIHRGTSLAAAHVSGALALLLSADPIMSADEQAAILIETADDLGAPGIDRSFGYGRLNIAAALDRVLGSTPVVDQKASTPTNDTLPIAGVILLGLTGLIGLMMWKRRSLRSAVWLAVLLVLSTVLAASAHAELIRSSPQADEHLAAAPAQVVLWFDEELVTHESTLRVFAADGRQVDTRDGYVDLTDPDHASLLASLPSLPDGMYSVRWRVVTFDDEGVTEGEFAFSVGAGARQPIERSSPTAAWLGWLLLLSVGVLLVIGLFAYRRLRQRP